MQLLDYEINDTEYSIWVTTRKKTIESTRYYGNTYVSLLLVDYLPTPLPSPVEKTQYSSEFPIEKILPEQVLAEVRLLSILNPTIRVGREELRLWT